MRIFLGGVNWGSGLTVLVDELIVTYALLIMQADGRIRYWGQVGKKWLRVVVENDTLHNPFFDRSYKP